MHFVFSSMKVVREHKGHLRILQLFSLVLVLLLSVGASLNNAYAGGGPEHVLLVANQNSADSKEVCAYYASKWNVPAKNYIEVDWPAGLDMMGGGGDSQHLTFQTPPFDLVDTQVKQPIYQYLNQSLLDIDYIVLCMDLPYMMSIDSNAQAQSTVSYLSAGKSPSFTNNYAYQYGNTTGVGTAYHQKNTQQYIVFHLFGYDVPMAKKIVDLGILADESHPNGTIYFQDTGSQVQNLRYPATLDPSIELKAMGIKVQRPGPTSDCRKTKFLKDVFKRALVSPSAS